MSFRAVLSIRSFRDLWLGQAISQMGDAFYYLTFMFMVDKVTGDPAMVGYVGALETLPFLVFGPYAGVLADRIDRRRIMLLSDWGSGLVLALFGASLAFWPTPSKWTLCLVPFLLSAIRVFFMPAKSAAIPALVPADRLMAANGLSMSTQNTMQLAGLSLSAGVVGALWAWSPHWFFLACVVLNGVSFFGSAAFIGRLPRLAPDRGDAHESHVLADLRNGLGYVRRRHDLSVLTVLLTLFRLMVAPFFVVYVAANNAWFGGRPQTLSWLEAAFFAGMILAGGLVGRIQPRRPTLWFCNGLAVVGVAVAAMAFSANFWLFVFWNFVAGLAVPCADMPILTYLQASVPDLYRGRVNALRDMVATGVMPVGMILGGQLVKRFGLEACFLTMGVGMAAACLFGLFDRRFREVAMPEGNFPPADEPALVSAA